MIFTFQGLIFKKVSLLINQLHLFLMENRNIEKKTGLNMLNV